ncbi:MAG: hypothetical protein HRF51_09870 [bacterium]|jgi:hypothetical protein
MPGHDADISKMSQKAAGIAAVTALLAVFFLLSLQTKAAEPAATEEIVVRFEIPKFVQKDIIAHYGNNRIYLPLVEIFSTLNINIKADFEKGKIVGEYFGSGKKYELDMTELKAKFSGTEFPLAISDFVVSPTEFFLDIEKIKEIFGLRLTFNFSALSVFMPLDREFPAYQKLLRRRAQEELKKSAQTKKDIVELPPHRENLRGGVADWTLVSTPLGGGGHYGNLNLGGMLLGGDIAVNMAGDNRTGFDPNQLRYRWHYYFSNNKYLTQGEAGNINTVGYLARSLEGVSISNRPQTPRKFFQSLNLEGYLGEGWEVELYVNNVLTDFCYTDQNGEYRFMTDILYGSSRVMLKMYGPGGEIRTEEKYINVPFNLVPRGEIEYTLAAGATEDQTEGQKYFQGMAYYGILHSLTAGIGGEAPLGNEAVSDNAYVGEMTFQPLGNLYLNGVFSPDNAARFSLGYTHSSMIGITGGYTRYYENPLRNRIRQRDNTTASLTLPIKIGARRIGLRYHFGYSRFPNYENMNMNYGLSGSVYRFHINYLGNFKKSRSNGRDDRELISQVFLSSSLLRWIKPQVRFHYSHTEKRLSSIGLYLNKRIFKRGQLAMTLERNMISRSNSIMFTFNFFAGAADFTSKYYSAAGSESFSQMQRGSVRFDQSTGSFRFDRRNGLGFGTAVVVPYHDANYNSKYDSDEKILTDLRAKVGGAAGRKQGEEQLYHFDNLRPYEEYLVQIDPVSLDDPQLRPAHENFRINVNPNVVTTIYVPVVTAGEVTGRVDRLIPDGSIGVGGIRILIENISTGKRYDIITFNNGEYYYQGLVPGMYRAYIDPEQLSTFGYKAEPSEIPFQIQTIEGGDYVDGIRFLISPE